MKNVLSGEIKVKLIEYLTEQSLDRQLTRGRTVIVSIKEKDIGLVAMVDNRLIEQTAKTIHGTGDQFARILDRQGNLLADYSFSMWIENEIDLYCRETFGDKSKINLNCILLAEPKYTFIYHHTVGFNRVGLIEL